MAFGFRFINMQIFNFHVFRCFASNLSNNGSNYCEIEITDFKSNSVY